MIKETENGGVEPLAFLTDLEDDVENQVESEIATSVTLKKLGTFEVEAKDD